MKVLFLFESALPKQYHSRSLSPGELRVIAAQDRVHEVIALGRRGDAFYDVPQVETVTSSQENKVRLMHFYWPDTSLAYYFSWIGLLWHGLNICRKHRISVIHAESPHISGIAACVLGSLFHAATVVEYRVSYDDLLLMRYGRIFGTVLRKLFWFVAGTVMNRAAYVAANSRSYQRYLAHKLNRDGIAYYCPGVRKPDTFTKSNHDGTIVGFIGRLYTDKNPLSFLKVINVEKTWFRKNNTTFRMAGDGPEKSILQRYIAQHHLSDLVCLLGTVDRWEFFRSIDICLNTTVVNAALEMTIAEAGSVGIPTIAFGNDDLPETVKHAYSGYIVPTGDWRTMARNLIRILKDHKEYGRLAKGALEVSRNYLFEIQVCQLQALYSSIAGS